MDLPDKRASVRAVASAPAESARAASAPRAPKRESLAKKVEHLPIEHMPMR